MTWIVFFGSPEFAVPSLQALTHDEHLTIEAVVTQPDKPKGRGKKLQPTPVADVATQLKLSTLKLNNLKEGHSAIRSFGHTDIFVVVAYGALLPPAILSLPKYGTINLHPSLLPKYRGASPIQTAILNGDHETGVTVMLLDEELDHGPILWQETVPIEHHDTAATLSERLAGIGAQLLATVIPLFIEGKIKPQLQDHPRATFTKQVTKEDGRIDWTKSADSIARMVRAYDPWPGAWTAYREKQGETPLKITAASALHQAHALSCGHVKELSDGSLAVACGENSVLKLITVQPPGKSAMPADAFVRGHRGFLGQILG